MSFSQKNSFITKVLIKETVYFKSDLFTLYILEQTAQQLNIEINFSYPRLIIYINPFIRIITNGKIKIAMVRNRTDIEKNHIVYGPC